MRIIVHVIDEHLSIYELNVFILFYVFIGLTPPKTNEQDHRRVNDPGGTFTN